MEQKIKDELVDKGHLIQTDDWDILLFTKALIAKDNNVIATIYKRNKDGKGNHEYLFSEEDINQLIQDLKDLSDWRRYKELKKKLN